MPLNEPHKQTDHSLHEDIQAFVLGTLLMSLAMQFITALGLITGQTAGLAVLLSYISDYSFGLIFFVINLPFYIFGYLRLGPRFTIKTFIAVLMVSFGADQMGNLVSFDALNPILGAVLGGCCAGLGLVVFFRHGASLGGVGVVALWAQDRYGVQAGWIQMGFDLILFILAIFILADASLVALSVLGALIPNLIIGVNHRKDRYIGR
ncbi:hypothetical protein BFP76_06660 [Amylibacter kogurei]|uniref:YitT family protein n=1 Tax=Paramylibacter kogurei TaxID=1889778 RepID=A0A2G5K7N6_9RHOB|nr:YitT family protein [Amylibacter kogurei]PIB25149.1 hypothetical protein BFP76_06660 [Amylibacter kogurei]